MPDWSSIRSSLEREGVTLSSAGVPTPVSGGDISAAWRVASDSGELFIKTGPESTAGMFAAEAEGLTAIADTDTIRVPQLIASGECEDCVFIALEWLDIEATNSDVDRCCGEQLAELHCASSERYGWHRDNSIGLTPQHNAWQDNWLDFFREQRLKFQLRLAADNGFAGQLQERGALLVKRLPVYFDGAAPSASLLHGDLWAGNWGCCDGAPVLFDPAVYYGDRESDLAMTRLFGGFGAAFYDAYESSWPLPEGHRERQHLYQLYHVLNHLNLFGSAYLGRAMNLIDKLL